MRYIELSSTNVFKTVIEDLKTEYGDLSRFLVPSDSYITSKGDKVITLYYNLNLW